MDGDPTHGSRLALGWREWIGLPDLGVARIKAKLDTGARTSALHAFDIERFREGGEERVRFIVHPYQRNTIRTVAAQATLIDERFVRNSGGGEERRPVIETRIDLLGQSWSIELTLASRELMGFRMLLGRQALRGRTFVDPGRSFLAGRRRRRARR